MTTGTIFLCKTIYSQTNSPSIQTGDFILGVYITDTCITGKSIPCIHRSIVYPIVITQCTPLPLQCCFVYAAYTTAEVYTDLNIVYATVNTMYDTTNIVHNYQHSVHIHSVHTIVNAVVL